jgi:hypothetical protein
VAGGDSLFSFRVEFLGFYGMDDVPACIDELTRGVLSGFLLLAAERSDS